MCYAADSSPLIPSPTPMKDRCTTRSQNHKLQQKSFSPSCDDFPHFDFSLGPSEFKTLYELLTAIYHGLVATNSPFASATREAMRLVDKVAAVSTFHMATAIQSSVQHQLSSPLLRTSQPSQPLPSTNPVCCYTADDALLPTISSLLESSTSQLEADISSLEQLFSLSEQLHVLKTSSFHRTAAAAASQALAARLSADEEIADLLAQYKSYQTEPEFQQLFQRQDSRPSSGSPGVFAMLYLDPEMVLLILTTTRIPDRISRTGTKMCEIFGATLEASNPMTVVIDVTNRTHVST